MLTAAFVGFCIFVLLAYVNVRVGGSILYPPAQMAVVWCVLIGLSILFANDYFPLSVKAVSIFCIGAVSFSCGGAFRLLVDARRPPTPSPTVVDVDGRLVFRVLTVALLALLALFPLFWDHMLSIADPHLTNLWWSLRSGAIAASDIQGPKPWIESFYENSMVASILLASTAVAYYGHRGSSLIVTVGLVCVAAVYNLATGSRAGASIVGLGAVGIAVLKRGRVSFRHVAAGVLAVGVMYVPITLLRAKGNNALEIAGDDLKLLGNTGLLYTVGSLAAFDGYLDDPAGLSETWSVSYFFRHTANRFGLDVEGPRTHMDYVAVTPNESTNLYTIYFAYYPEFGILGVVVFTALVGYATTWLCRAASIRRRSLLILYGIAFQEICKTGFSEGFFLGLNLWIKAAVFCCLIYGLEKLGARRSIQSVALEPVSVV